MSRHRGLGRPQKDGPMTTKTKTPPDTTRLALYLTTEQTAEYFHVIARVVTIGLTRHEREDIDAGLTVSATSTTIRNLGKETVRGLYLADFRIDSQGTNGDADRHLYAWQYRYHDVYDVDRPKAEAMAKTLKTLETRLAKTDETYGRPKTFGSYVARLAVALGADTILRPRADTSRGWSYADTEHTWHTIQAGVDVIDHLVRTWTDRRERVA